HYDFNFLSFFKKLANKMKNVLFLVALPFKAGIE
ncbi:MAG: hypothetical protein JWM28_2269, partial [Chitinophagaceae bacterium]|nr:hypothetical protein [Chitinophagaceae bacterium]